MEWAALLVVLPLVGLLILGVLGMVRGKPVRSCCEPRQNAQKNRKSN